MGGVYMSYDLGSAVNALFDDYTTNPYSYADFSAFLDRVGEEYRKSASSPDAERAVETMLSAAKKAEKQLEAQKRGDVVNISEAARKIFQQYKYESEPSGHEMPHGEMQAMTSQGTMVTVEAKSAQQQKVLHFGGEVGKSLTRAMGNTAMVVKGQEVGESIELEYSVSFRRQGGQIQTFDIKGNTVFRENKDGTIISEAGGKGKLQGSEGQDIMINITDNTTVNGGGGDDLIFNFGQNSRLQGGAGDDVIMSRGNNAMVSGGEGEDAIAILQDSLRASFDNQAPDSIKEKDEKTIYSRPRFSQTVSVDGGDGDDAILLSPTMYKSKISGGSGMDDIYANDLVHSSLDAGDGSDTVRLGKATKSDILLGAGSDIMTAEKLMKSTVKAGDGNDDLDVKESYMSTINAGKGDDIVMVDKADKSNIIGGSGNDYIYVQESIDTSIRGGAGDDFIRAGTIQGGTIEAGSGNDYIVASLASGSIIKGDEGNDRIRLEHSSVNDIDGGAGDDEIFLGTDNRSTVTGGAGNDIVTAESTNMSVIDGGSGDNILTLGTDTGPQRAQGAVKAVDLRV